MFLIISNKCVQFSTNIILTPLKSKKELVIFRISKVLTKIRKSQTPDHTGITPSLIKQRRMVVMPSLEAKKF